MFIFHLTFTDSLIYCFTLWFRQLTKFISFSYFNDTPNSISLYTNYKTTAVSHKKNHFFSLKFKIPLDKSVLPMTTQNYAIIGVDKFSHVMCLTIYRYIHHDDNIYSCNIERCRPIVIWYVHSYFIKCEPTFVLVMHAFVIEHNVEIKSIYCTIWEYLQAWKSYSTFD